MPTSSTPLRPATRLVLGIALALAILFAGAAWNGSRQARAEGQREQRLSAFVARYESSAAPPSAQAESASEHAAELADDPRVEAGARRWIASVFLAGSELERALEELERARSLLHGVGGPGDLELGRTLGELAQAWGALAEAQADEAAAREALRLEERALEIVEARLGGGHPELALRLSALARAAERDGRLTQALTARERALAVRLGRFGEASPEVAESFRQLSELLERMGHAAEARETRAAAERAARR